MKTTSIKIEGQIISSEIFDKIDSAEIHGQLPKDFGFESGTKVKDEIQRAWANAKDQWKIFNRNIEKLGEDDIGTTETRKYWIIPFLDNLGYQLNVGKAETVNEKSYAISHRASNIDNFPVHIVSYKDSLDKRREGSGPRLSPHALVQEYLNLTEHLYALVTNGNQLRVLRDSGKLIRLTYLEFDLQKMMEEDLYAEFSIMYRIIHSTRMPQKIGEGDLSLIEGYHQDSLEAGARIREKLSEAVERSIVILADGFLKNRNNEELRKQIEENQLDAEKLYQYLLRFIYRVLFLMVIEERDIVYPENGKDVKYFKNIYYDNYSISRLRKLSEKIFFFNDKLNDLWIQLRNTFKIFGDERLAEKLKLYPLDGELFDFGALGILSESDLDNQALLKCIKNLSQFEDDKTHSVIRVNYSALNVEEFGSVYEGLLEKDPSITEQGNNYKFTFVKGSERSSSGSHYTPEELVQPLIKHSLDYVIEDKIKAGKTKEEKESNLLSIKVCDVACGSGHILLSAARRIAQELTRVRTGEDQPSPEPFREATRDVINNCIYGVDKNPLAVELCKVALWLEAHNPGMPLNFLDNKIRCGDSIVGLGRIEELQNGIATEAFKTLPGDDKTIASEFRKKNKEELQNRDQYTLTDKEEVIEKLNNISVKFKSFNELPDNTVEAVRKKAEEFDVLKGTDWWHLKEAADLQVAQFFIPKDSSNKNFLTTDRDYFRVLAGDKAKHERQISTAMAVAAEKKFFHWFLEFPEVFAGGGSTDEASAKSGFDCILGNPPFLGNRRIRSILGDNIINYLLSAFYPTHLVEFVVYFFRRINEIMNKDGFQALLATNTVSQGNARESGLEYLLEKGTQINYAIKSMKWPGVASLQISVVCLNKMGVEKNYLNNQLVDRINSYLDSDGLLGEPFLIKSNEGVSYNGYLLGDSSFVLQNKIAEEFLRDVKNGEIIKPIINGSELYEDPKQLPDRHAIFYSDKTLEEAKNYKDVFEYLDNNFSSKKKKRKNWWRYARTRPEFRSQLGTLKNIFAVALTSKTLAFVKVPSHYIFTHAIGLFVNNDWKFFSIVQSYFHSNWAWKYASTLKTDLRYTASDVFETFPFPQNLTKETEEELEKIGEEYHEFRRQLMLDLQLGLTKTYNLFHNPEVRSGRLANGERGLEKIKEVREFKNANLQIPIEEAIKKIEKLRELHKQMDEAVLKAYNWTDIDLVHNFYEVDYLPENDRVRYTISPEARKEVLKRLLELNHKIHEEEVKAGDKSKSKGKSKKEKVKSDANQNDLFGG